MKNLTGSGAAAKMFLALIVPLLFTAWLDPFRDEVSRGNGRYNDKKYDEAGDHYKKAEEYAPGEESKKKLSLNRGNAYFKKGEYQKALDSYKMSLQSNDRDVQKKSFFNMGNTYMKMDKNKEAVESFVNALKIDPGYEKAKRNIEYLLSKKQKQKQKDKNKNNKDSDRKKKEKNKDRQENEKNDKNKKDRSKNSAGKKKMSREQLKSLLESMKKKPVRRQKGSRGGRRYLEKQW
jgi:tetratricopeptide (TPR) repeat protein